jgi:hypothetical protein
MFILYKNNIRSGGRVVRRQTANLDNGGANPSLNSKINEGNDDLKVIEEKLVSANANAMR